MARINVSVPDEMKLAMDGFPDVNWSHVAQEAFSHVLKIEQLKKGDAMKEAGIERLRSSRNKNHEVQEAKGLEFGREWALEKAEYDQLERVAALQEPAESWEVTRDSLLEALGEDTGFPDDCLEQIFDTPEPSTPMLSGFVIGAAEVYEAV